MPLSRLMWSAYLACQLYGQARLPFKPLDAIKSVQRRRVRWMVSHAYRTVPYYRETMNRLGLRPEDLQMADDLVKLPLIERDQLQRDPEYFLSTAKPMEQYLELRSGGSSGMPCTVYHDTAAVFQNAAHAERERSILTALLGKSFGYRQTLFASPLSTDRLVQEFCRKRGLFPSPLEIKRQYLPLMAPPEKNIPLLNEFKPDVIHGFGSYLEEFFSYLHATGRAFHRPRVVTYSSDPLSNAARRLITETMGIPVLSTYETIEAFKIGFECEENMGLHTNIDLYPLRIVNAGGESQPNGQSGNVVVSNLVNRATVLLNYRLDDISCMLPDSCPCGRTLPLLSLPQGRSGDWIEQSSGKIVHPQSVADIFDDIGTVRQFQVIQESQTYFRALIVAPTNHDPEAISRLIIYNFKQMLGENITLDLIFVDQIARTEGGKLRPVVSKLGRESNAL